ncbi:MAG: DUF1003 domain-containing protein [Ferrovibrio sp.]|jgi:uncharacterized membrane protein|uniref:DUF1003 domain-containing protein n=1 Tax=Ferrovibrio sp. TaxID=1917215 RepID=UPI003919720D
MTNSHRLTEQDTVLLRDLRRNSAHRRTVHHAAGGATIGARVSDAVAAVVGSWRFILLQTGLLAAWLVGNAIVGRDAWDPYPFILLNLLLSFQAAYTAPIIMMSQNRQADIDRQRAESDYSINIKAELEIELLHQKIDLLREQEILALTKAVNALVEKVDGHQGENRTA